MHNDTSTFADPQLESLLPATASGRRGFLAAASTVGFALAAGPVQAQSVIRTSADGLDAGDIWVPVGSEKMPAYMAAPAKAGKYPVVIVVPEVFGMHEYQKDICRRLAKLGYVGITSDPFFRSGDLSKMTNIGEVVGMANKLADTQMLSDVDDLVAFIEKQPKAHAGKIGITGMCRGGRTVWMAIAHNKKIKAGVSWYGGLNPIPVSMPQTPHDVAGALNGPVWACMAVPTPAFRCLKWPACRKCSRPATRTARPAALCCTPAWAMLSTPTIAQVTARKRPRTAGRKCWPGSRPTASPDAWDPARIAGAPVSALPACDLSNIAHSGPVRSITIFLACSMIAAGMARCLQLNFIGSPVRTGCGICP